jgi:hypothetical protein
MLSGQETRTDEQIRKLEVQVSTIDFMSVLEDSRRRGTL